MEWTGQQLRQLCVDNGVEFRQAEAIFGQRLHSLSGTTFTLVFQDGSYEQEYTNYQTNKKELRLVPFVVSAVDNENDGRQGFALSLSTYLSVCTQPTEDTYEGWSAAFKTVLSSPDYKQFKKYVGLGGVLEAFKKLLVEKLGALGAVKLTKRKTFYDTFVVKGVGAVQFWDTHSADCLYVGPASGENTGRGWGDVKFSAFKDDLDAKADEVVALLKAQAVKHGTLTAEVETEPSPADFAKAGVEYVGYNLDTGDNRTCGSLSVTWKSPLGELRYQRVYDTAGDVQEDSWFFNDSELVENQEKWDEAAGLLELDPPHYTQGQKAVTRWEKEFEGFDGGDLQAALLELTK